MRAGDQRPNVKGRPGVNPLRFYNEVDSDTIEDIKTTAKKLGLWITEIDDGVWILNPPGVHNSIQKFVESDVDGAQMVLNERAREANLSRIRDAASQADIV